MGATLGLLGLVQCCLPLGSHDAVKDEDERQPLLAHDGVYIVVLHHGRIVEQGSHEKLLASMGRYANLWATKEPYHKNEPLPRYIDGSTSTEDKSVIEHPASSSPVKTPKRHRREGSKLNPDAPEFTPGALAAAQSQPSPFVSTRIETPTPAQRATPLPENIALPPSAAPAARGEFRFPLVSPRRRFESKSETKEDSDGYESPRRVSAPSPKCLMGAVLLDDDKQGCGTLDNFEAPGATKKIKPADKDTMTANTIKNAAAPTTKTSASQHPTTQNVQAVNAPATAQRGHARPRGRFARGRGRRGGRSGTSRGSTEGGSGLPLPTRGH